MHEEPFPHPSPPPLATLRSALVRGGGRAMHAHDKGQFLSVKGGSIVLTICDMAMVVPSHRAVWIPAGLTHECRHVDEAQLRSIYLSGPVLARLPGALAVVEMTPLLDAIFDNILTFDLSAPLAPAQTRLLEVLADQIAGQPMEIAGLPMPRSAQLQAVAERLLRHDEGEVPVEILAREAGLTVRTLERRFRAELSMSLRQFRVQAKMMRAMELLSAGQSVKETAFRLNYQNAASFVEMFRKMTGYTPARHQRAGPLTR